MAASHSFWDELFESDSVHGRFVPVRLRLVRKHGQPFLLLPSRSRSAAATLTLYPAQTGRARLAKALLGCLLRLSLPIGVARLDLILPLDTAFMNFLTGLGFSPPGSLPEFGILAGNPASDGQRFLVVLFDADQRPVRVVKAGTSARARELVKREGTFLSAAAGRARIPRLLAVAETRRWHALALDYCSGKSPGPRHSRSLPGVLEEWVDPKTTVALGGIPEWQRLERVATTTRPWLGSSRDRKVSVTLQHGDFAPWNIKVTANGGWQVLDWERGELVGMPGWDWFHYIIQTAILVEREPVAELMARVETLLAAEPFKRYAATAGIVGLERQLVLDYLLHCVEIIQPSEGLESTRDLLSALRNRWGGPS